MKTIKGLAALAAGTIIAAVAGPADAAWQYFNPTSSHYSSLDVTEGLVCAELGVMSGNGDNNVMCAAPSGSTGVSLSGFLNNGAALPGNVDAIAVFNTKTASGTHIHILGSDDVVRTYTGNQAAATWYSQPGFVSPVSTTQPIDVDTNATISIVDIVAVYAGWLGGTRHVLMALTSNGLAYQKYGTKWRKHPRLNSLNVTFKRVSSQKPLGGSYWATSTGDIYYAYDLNTAPGPILSKLTTYPGKIRDLGFPYILTNAGGSANCNPLVSNCYVSCTVATGQCNGDVDRVQRLSGGSWSPFPVQLGGYNPGMPGTVPATSDGSPTDAFGPKNHDAIVDGASFRGVAGEYFIHHFTNKWFYWTP